MRQRERERERERVTKLQQVQDSNILQYNISDVIKFADYTGVLISKNNYHNFKWGLI